MNTTTSTQASTAHRTSEEVDYTAWLRINSCRGDLDAAVKSLHTDRRLALSSHDFADAKLLLAAADVISRRIREEDHGVR